jgi:hypothetical protein
MQLSDFMQLNKMEKEQLVGLCNAMYELLQQRQAPSPAFTFFPPQPTVQPFVAPNNPWPMWNGNNVICNESTQQERFGVK